jgi:Protein of unknown function (DUF667)
MFSTEFQGGNQGIEVLSPAGKNPPTRLLKINGSPGLITKDYERDIKGFKYTLSGRGSQSSSIQCPSVTKDSLALTQPLLVLQLKSAVQEDPLNLEVVVLDSGGQRRRFLFSTTFRSMDVNSLHAQIPWVQGSRDVWTNVVFNMLQLTQQCFSSKFASIDSFLLRPCCSLRKIFTLPAILLLPPSVEGGDDNGLIIPVTFDFPMGTISTTYMFSLKRSSSSSSRQVSAPSLPGSELQVSALQIRSRKSSSSAARKVDASPLRSGSATSRVKGAPLAACPEESAMMRSEMLVAAGTRALSAGSNRSARVDVNALKCSALSNLNTRKEKTLVSVNDKISSDTAQIDELSKLLTMGIDSRTNSRTNSRPDSRIDSGIESPRSPTIQSLSMKNLIVNHQTQGSRSQFSSSKSSPNLAADRELELELKDEKNVYDFSNLATDQWPSSSARQRDHRDQPIYRNFTDSRPGTASSGMSSLRQTSRPNSARHIDQRIYQTGGVGATVGGTVGVDEKSSFQASVNLLGDTVGGAGSQGDAIYKMRERLVIGANHEESLTHRPLKITSQNLQVNNQLQQSLLGVARSAPETLLIGEEDDQDQEQDQEDSCDLPISVFSWGNRYYPKSAHDDIGIYGSNMADYNRNIGGLYGSVDNIVADDVLRGSLTRASMTSIVSLSDNFDNETVKVDMKETTVIPARTPLSVQTETDPHRDTAPTAEQPSSVLRSFKEEEMRAMKLLYQLTSGYDREANDNIDTHTDIHNDRHTDTHTDTHAKTHTDIDTHTHTDTHINTHTDTHTGTGTTAPPLGTVLSHLPLRSTTNTSTLLTPTHHDTDPSVADTEAAHTHTDPDAITAVGDVKPVISTTQVGIYDTLSPQQQAQLHTQLHTQLQVQAQAQERNFSPHLQGHKDDTFSPLLQPRIDDSFSPILTTRRVDAPVSARNNGGKVMQGKEFTDDTVSDGGQGTGTGTEMETEMGSSAGPTPKLIALSKQLQSVLTVLTHKERVFIEEFGERCYLAIR